MLAKILTNYYKNNKKAPILIKLSTCFIMEKINKMGSH